MSCRQLFKKFHLDQNDPDFQCHPALVMLRIPSASEVARGVSQCGRHSEQMWSFHVSGGLSFPIDGS